MSRYTRQALPLLTLVLAFSCAVVGVGFSGWRAALSGQGYYYYYYYYSYGEVCGSGSLTLTGQPGSTIDLGWTGAGHHVPLSSGLSITADLDCDDGAGCSIEGSFLAGGPFGSPLPLAFGGLPICLVGTFREGMTGTYDCASGCANATVKLDTNVFVTADASEPCPTCEGDINPNDGIKDGLCNGGVTPGVPCDVAALSSLGNTSNDCLPGGSSVGAPRIDLEPLTTGLLVFTAATECVQSGFGSQCHCPDQLKPNACLDGVCGESGICENGPIDSVCSGDQYRPCQSGSGTTDCDDAFPGAGVCVEQPRACFPSTIVASGYCGTPDSNMVGVFCSAATESGSVNSIAGLPGPGVISLPFQAALAITLFSPPEPTPSITATIAAASTTTPTIVSTSVKTVTPVVTFTPPIVITTKTATPAPVTPSPTPTAAVPQDSFLCYAAKPATTAPAPGPHQLKDPLVDAHFDIGKITVTCLAAVRHDLPPSDRARGLLPFAIKASKVCSDTKTPCGPSVGCNAGAKCVAPKLAVSTPVVVLDPVGTLVETVGKPKSLRIPTIAVGAPGAPAADAYACYAVKERQNVCAGDPLRGCKTASCGGAGPCFDKFKKTNVRLETDLTSPAKVFTLKKPSTLCLPATLDGVLPEAPDAALQCYSAVAAKKQCGPSSSVNAGAACAKEEDCGGTRGATAFCQTQPAQAAARVLVVGGFGSVDLGTKKEIELCLPAEIDLR